MLEILVSGQPTQEASPTAGLTSRRFLSVKVRDKLYIPSPRPAWVGPAKRTLSARGALSSDPPRLTDGSSFPRTGGNPTGIAYFLRFETIRATRGQFDPLWNFMQRGRFHAAGPRGRRGVPSSRDFAVGSIPDEMGRPNFAGRRRRLPLFRRASWYRRRDTASSPVPRSEDDRSTGCFRDVRPFSSLGGEGG